MKRRLEVIQTIAVFASLVGCQLIADFEKERPNKSAAGGSHGAVAGSGTNGSAIAGGAGRSGSNVDSMAPAAGSTSSVDVGSNGGTTSVATGTSPGTVTAQAGSGVIPSTGGIGATAPNNTTLGGSAPMATSAVSSGGAVGVVTSANRGGTTSAATTATTSPTNGGTTVSPPNGGTTHVSTSPTSGGTTNVSTTAANGGTPATGGTSSQGNGGTATASGGTRSTTTSPPTPAEIVPSLAAGFYWEGTCNGSISVTGHNCPMLDSGTNCPSGGITRDLVLNVNGTIGQLYTVNIEVRGVVGTRCYQNGTRAATAAPSETAYNNWWYVGGVPYNATGWWNTFELHVAPSTGDASGDVYYFNGADANGGSWCEKEATYLVKYDASFKVKGGGTMTFRLHDQNCKAQQNCGPNIDPSSTCNPRTVDLTGMSPQPPVSFVQPPTNDLSKTFYPQWLWITATSVTSP